MARDDADEFAELLLVGKLSVEDQVRHLEERALLGELLDGITAVLQDALVAVDKGNARAAAGRRHETGIIGELSRLAVQRAHVDYFRPDGATEHRKIHG